MSKKVNVVSLFDGISCGRVALDRAGIAVNFYDTYEIDKYAKSISKYNYPDITNHGDVLTADFSEFVGYDLVMGGSPCTFWSIAKTNREVDKDGIGWKLFMCFVEAMRTIKPRIFLYENVASMPQSIKAYITEELGVEPILINSALVSAQQRKRLYWTNIEGVEQPQDRGILLKDILESGIVGKEKSNCIDACYYKGGNNSRPLSQSGRRNTVYEPIALADKSQTILSTIHKENAVSMVMRSKTGLICAQEIDENCESMGAALRTRADENGSFKRLEIRDDGKSNALTTVLTDSVVCSPIRVGSLGNGGQGNRIYSIHGKVVSLMANGGGCGGKTGLYKIDLPDGDYTIRKLTIKEAERCQTLPDDYTALGIDDNGNVVKISDTQRYKCVGNGWTVDVIAHILSYADF
ncbi:hypothetical protein FACS1894120_1200 [Clostridia bacterium]|nr:hypothetical protein FACS1894120_1200 [Clostridia bacterium]